MYTPSQPKLITGNARSGTTFISAQIESKFDIAIPVESFFIPHFERYAGLFKAFEREDRSDILAQCIQDYLEISLYAGVKSMSPDSMLRNSILSVLYRHFDECSTASNYQQFLIRLFDSFAQERGAQCWAEKGMNYELEELERYDTSFGQLRVLHIVRDGRDVALSWRSQWFGPKTLAESAYLWRKHVNHYRHWGELNPDRYLEITYEDYLDNTDASLERIGRFFNLEPIAQGNKSTTLQESLASEVWTQNLSKPPMRNNKEKWRSSMNEFDKRLFDSIAGRELKLFGYESSSLDRNISTQIGCRLYFSVGMLRRMTDPNFYRRKLRRHLPLILLLVRRFMPWVATKLVKRVVVRGQRLRQDNA